MGTLSGSAIQPSPRASVTTPTGAHGDDAHPSWGTGDLAVPVPQSTAGQHPAAGAPFAVGDAPALTAAQAFEDIVAAVRTLATMRGHLLGSAVQDARYELSIQCGLCERWVTFALDGGTLNGGKHRGGKAGAAERDVGITGQVLAPCRGKPWGPIAAEPRSSGEDTYGLA